METSIEIERLDNDEEVEFLPSHEILRENLKRTKRRPPAPRWTEYRCDECNKVFSDKYGLHKHKWIHNPENPFECPKCEYKAKTKQYINAHINKVHGGRKKTFECGICDKRFLFQCQLDKHSRVHTGEKPNKCDVCGKAFNSKYSLKVHGYIHTNQKPYKCAFCEYACRDSSTLRKHQSKHMGTNKRYHCDLCPCNYDAKSKLKDHVEEIHLHIEKAKLSCSLCDAKFKGRAGLTSHVNTVHKKLKQCMCGICGKTLTNSANLKTHMLTHVDLRPYRCPHPGCDKKYKDNSTLKKHSVLHCPEKYMFCDECGKGFTRRIRLVKHFAFHRKRDQWVRRKRREDAALSKLRSLSKRKRKPLPAEDHEAKYICDTCGFYIASKESLEMHLKYAKCSSECTKCMLCDKTFRKNLYLKQHYLFKHKFSNKNDTPMVQIKEEPADIIPDIEVDLLDIKEEPFLGFDTDSQEFDQISSGTQEIIANGDKEDSQSVHSGGNTKTSTDSKNTPRRTMEVAEFLQRVISHAENADEQILEEKMEEAKEEGEESGEEKEKIEEVETAEYMKECINALWKKSNEKNGIKPHTARSVKRFGADEVEEFLSKNIKYIRAPDITEPVKTKVKIEKVKKPKKRKRKKMRDAVDDTTTQEDKPMSKKKNKTEKDETKNRKSKTKRKSKDAFKVEKPKVEKIVEPTMKDKYIEKQEGSVKENLKMIFSRHECYVCYKIFQSKPELIDHCKEHFDVCNEITLKKCPLCTFVTRGDIKRHVKIMHNLDINFKFMQVKDKKENTEGSRYYYDIENSNVKHLEIIPSVKILNKKACMELDKKNREHKNKCILKRKLVRKGKEWIVEMENLDVSECLIPQLKETENYLEKIRKVNLEAKKNGEKMLFPCNSCEKICQNLSALTLHMRKHNPNAKPFKPKRWKHKNKGQQVEKTAPVNLENRLANPKPIVNNHKCDPELKLFYETNIKGGDIEFWQFLKIYNKMGRDNVNDFKDLTGSTAFGVHCNDEINIDSVNDDGNTANINDNDDIASFNDKGNIASLNDKFGKGNKNNDVKSVKYSKELIKPDVINNKGKYIRKIAISKSEYRKRCEIKKKLREEIARRQVT